MTVFRSERAFQIATALLVVASLTMLGLVGCNSDQAAATPPEPSSVFLSNGPIDDPLSLTDAAASLQTDTNDVDAGTTQINLLGRIAGGDVSPFDPDQAVFVLTEAPSAEHDTDDPEHADNCPFCRRRAKNAPTAMVTLVDPQTGSVPKQSAETILGLKIGDRVTVVGDVSYDADLKLLSVQTSRVSIKR